MPHEGGSAKPSSTAAAIAASTALPPSCMSFTATCAASGCEAAHIPSVA